MRRACRPSPAWLRWALPACAVLLLAPRPALGQCAGPAFSPFAGPTVSGEPWGVVVGDFWGATGDPDGRLDVVVAKKSANMVTLLRGDGLGSFLAPIDIPVGSGPTDLVAADFNRDGRLDLAVVVGVQALPPVNRVQLLAGTGGGFSGPVDLDVGDLPSRLATGDFNRDAKPDLVVLSWSAQTVQVFEGDGLLGFTLQTPAPVIPASSTPTAAVSGDFNLDGAPDLAVTLDTFDPDEVVIYLGDGTGHLGDTPSTEDPFATITVGTTPLDIAVGDVNRDGKLDLVTADLSSVAVSVLIGAGNGTFTREPTSPATGAGPIRAILEDYDRDGFLDVATLEPPGGPPVVTVLPGTAAPPFFDAGSPTTLPLGSSTHEGLAVGDLDADGRPDLVATEGTGGNVVVAINTASPDCLHTSFVDAPRAYPSGNGPVWLAVADPENDGIDDLVVADSFGRTLELLRGTGNGYTPNGSVDLTGRTPRGVAAADFDVDGDSDVAVALGSDVQLFMWVPPGVFVPGTIFGLGGGATASAVVTGDFNGDGAPDVAATDQNGGVVHILLGDGVGGLVAAPGSPVASGTAPRGLAAGYVDGGFILDLVVANSGSNDVTVLLGNGDGSFTPFGPPLSAGGDPRGVALADFDGDARLDLVTGDWNSSTATVWFGLGTGGFVNRTQLSVTGQPFAVAAFDVTADAPVSKADIMVVTNDHTLALHRGNGDGTFQTEVSFPVRRRPSSIAAVDADADGRPDLAIPCRDADSVAVLLSRPPGFAQAPRVAVVTTPVDAVAADLDADGDVDLAVVASASNDLTVLENNGSGTFTPRPALGVSGLMPVSVVAADFDRNGVLDLATSNFNSGTVSILHGDGALGFTLASSPAAGVAPDELVAGDFDRDGDVDLAVCNYDPSGKVSVLLYDHLTDTFGPPTAFPPDPEVLGNPTGIFSADLDGDGILDLAVANDSSNDLAVLFGDGAGAFSAATRLALPPGDTSPLSVAGSDLDSDGDLDLATVGSTDVLNLFTNTGGTFAGPVSFPAAYEPQFVVSADANRDGKPDLVLGTDGLDILRGDGALGFEPTEGFVAGLGPRALTIDDFDRDGRPDVAVVNQTSNDVSILLSSACLARRQVLSMSPPACRLGAPPYLVPATVQVQDDGGNLAFCASGDVTGSIVPGTGTVGASYTPPNPVALSGGVADFSGHMIDLAGPRYQLQFELPGLLKVVSRSFTLGPSVTITGPPSVCSAETYTADLGFDSYEWTLDVSPPPHGFGPTTTVDLADGVGPHTLSVDARVDGCVAMDSTSVYVGDLASVSITPAGPVTVCVDCLGGAVTATETGGGSPVTRQWGYRTVSGSPPIDPIPGQTSDTYVINGLDFPGVGTYYLVETTTPVLPTGCGGPVTSNEVAVTITATVPGGEVESLGATSRGPGGVGENVLQWKNSVGSPVEILIRWNKATTGSSICAPPPDAVAPAFGEQPLSPPFFSTTMWPHSPLELDTAYCYSIFVKPTAVSPYSPGRTVKARPFDTSTGPVWWAYATGATAVVPPTVGFDGIVALSNDRSVHSLERGIGGGTWPPLWVPSILNGVVHSRSPVGPFVAAADALLFVGDDAGEVHAINARTGQIVWGPIPFAGAMITGAPGAFVARWGGPRDVVLIGTRVGGAGYFYTRDLMTGAPLDSYDGAGALGPMTSTPALDYPTGRAYFTSWGLTPGTTTVWCVEVDGGGVMTRCSGWTLPDLDDIDASPVLSNGRVYVANTAGMVYSLDATDGTPGPAFPTGDGPVKGFLFPDRRGDDFYFATDTKVWSVTDTAGVLSTNWTWKDGVTPLDPSIVLHWPNTDYLYVGAGDGRLYQLDFSVGPPSDPCSPPSCKVAVLGDGADRLGAPSLDNGVVFPDVPLGKKLLHVGSEAGVLYAVEVPLP